MAFLLAMSVLPLTGCVAGFEYAFQPERDDAVIGEWVSSSKGSDGQEDVLHIFVYPKNAKAYRAVVVSNEALIRFDFLLSRIDGNTYANIDLSTVSSVEHRSDNTETLKHATPAYFLLRYHREGANLIVTPIDQNKAIDDFQQPTRKLGTAGGACAVSDALSQHQRVRYAF